MRFTFDLKAAAKSMPNVGLSELTTFIDTTVPSGARTRFVNRSLGRTFFRRSLMMVR
jgi:hypothetical protein